MIENEKRNNTQGIITFLFTDIEGSTKLAQKFSSKLTEVLDIHNSILTDCIESNNGHVFKTIGDAFCCAFNKPEDAVKAAVESQKKLLSEKWKYADIKVRMGIHTGPAERNGADYMGYLTLARTQRVMSAASGDQILITEDTYRKLGALYSSEISFRNMGSRRLKDLIQPMNLYQIQSPGLPAAFPPLKTLDARPNNLPIQLSSFIGRVNEISEVKEIIMSSRLVTLLGPGGTGKTRLSLQVCAEIIDEFANGVWFAELAQINDSFLIPLEIIKVLGIKDQSGQNPEKVISDYLKDKELIIILDNCEHLINDCAVLAENLLKSSPKVKIIATSRESFRIRGEQVYKLLSLSFPDPVKKISAKELVLYESVRLFIERALTVNPEFRVTDDNADSLSEICFRLDGIPLAIELAAARTKILNVEKLNEKLKDRFKLLKSGSRTDLPRQQTLKALIDWSYDLLPDVEKEMWKKISVFNGGFNLEAAEKICPDENTPEEDIPELLNNLCEKSIIMFDTENDRFKILETIRQYGLELYGETGDEIGIMNKHFLYYFNLVKELTPKLKGKEIPVYMKVFDSERGNIETALEWSVKSGNYNEGAEMLISLGRYWSFRDYNYLGFKWCGIITEFNESLNKSIYANLINWQGQYLSNQGEYEQAEEYFEKSFQIYEKLGDISWKASTLNSLGALAARKGDLERAFILLERCHKYKNEIGDNSGICGALCNLGQLAILLGELDKAQKYSDEVLNKSTELGDRLYMYLAFRLAGQLHSLKGNMKSAEEHYLKAIELTREVSYNVGISACLAELAELLIYNDEKDRAEKLLDESLVIAENIEEKFFLAMAANIKGLLLLEKGDILQSEKEYEKSLEIYETVKDKNGLARAICGLANVKFRKRDFEESLKLFRRSLELHYQMNNKLEISNVLLHMSGFCLQDKLNEDIYFSAEDSFRLYILSEEIKKKVGIVKSKLESAKSEKILSALFEKLKDSDPAKITESIKGMKIEQAVNLALGLNGK